MDNIQLQFLVFSKMSFITNSVNQILDMAWNSFTKTII
jgi:hypothetical protein